MLQNCGEFTVHYNETTTGIALNYLLGYLKEQQINLKTHEDQGTFNSTLMLLNLKHYDLIKVSVQDFINGMFGVDYMTKKAWTTLSIATKKIHKKKNCK